MNLSLILPCPCHRSPNMMLSLLNHIINDAVTDELAAETDQWSAQSEHSAHSAGPHTALCSRVKSSDRTDSADEHSFTAVSSVCWFHRFNQRRSASTRNKAAWLAVRPAAKRHIGNNRTSVGPSSRPIVSHLATSCCVSISLLDQLQQFSRFPPLWILFRAASSIYSVGQKHCTVLFLQ